MSSSYFFLLLFIITIGINLIVYFILLTDKVINE